MADEPALNDVVLGALRVLTASLWPVIALHAAHNLTLACSTAQEVHWSSVAVAGVVAAVLLARTRAAERALAPPPDAAESSAIT